MKKLTLNLAALVFCALLFATTIFAQTTAFTYQGKLTDGANAAPTGTYDVKFDLYDMDVDGTLIGSVTVSNVFVNQGVFTTSLNFGATAFDGGERYLEIAVRPAGSSAARTVLSPRQRIVGVPYATQSRKATTAVNFSGNLTGDVTGTQTATVVSTVGGETAANVAAGAQIANAATSANVSNAVVRRDASGNFAASNVVAGNVTLAAGGKVTFGDGTQQATSVDPSLFVVRNSQSGSVLVADTRLTVTVPAQDGDAFRINSPETNSNVRGGLIARFRSGSPLSDRFRFDQAGGFVALSAIGFGIIPTTGAGDRMMWHPYKAAIRAGGIDGTQWDDANVGFYSLAGGYNTIASGNYSFAAGYGSEASNSYATAFGYDNSATASGSVAGGYGSAASGSYSTAIGFNNFATGTGSVALGYRAFASADYSVAIGQRATNCTSVTTTTTPYTCNSPFTGVISIADGSTTAFLAANANNQFNVRAAGGYRLYSNALMTSGVSLSAGGGSWATLSDRNAKENFGAVNPRDVLKKVLTLPISTWSYKGQSFRHIGAMAQDFYQTFGVGENDKTITTVDPDGVAFAAIQGLNEEIKERDGKIEQQQQKIEQQQKQLNQLQETVSNQQTMINALRKFMCGQNPQAEICGQK